MRAEDRRDNEALYNKMTISEIKQNFTEPSSGADVQVSVPIYLMCTSFPIVQYAQKLAPNIILNSW